MAEPELNVDIDSLIARLLEGKFSGENWNYEVVELSILSPQFRD